MSNDPRSSKHLAKYPTFDGTRDLPITLDKDSHPTQNQAIDEEDEFQLEGE